MGKPGIPGKISYVYGGSPEKRRARNADLYSAGQSRADVIVFPESFQDSFRPGGNVSSACIGITESSGISTVCERNAYIKNRIF